MTQSGHWVRLPISRLEPVRCPVLRFGGGMRRREFIKLLGGAVSVLPSYSTLAQQKLPLVGFLNSASPDTYRFNADSFREGLSKAGFVEGRNLRIESGGHAATMMHYRHLRLNLSR